MTPHKHKHSYRGNGNIDLYGDVEKIKEALLAATYDVKGKAAEMLTQSVESAKERSDQFRDTLADYTADKPFKSLGIALLSGIVIGYFLHKK